MGLALLAREWFLAGGGELSLNLNMRPDISYAPMEGPRRTHDPVPWFQDIVISAHLVGHFCILLVSKMQLLRAFSSLLSLSAFIRHLDTSLPHPPPLTIRPIHPLRHLLRHAPWPIVKSPRPMINRILLHLSVRDTAVNSNRYLQCLHHPLLVGAVEARDIVFNVFLSNRLLASVNLRLVPGRGC
jgi:hypothetical protein